jgi:hypothetical protein
MDLQMRLNFHTFYPNLLILNQGSSAGGPQVVSFEMMFSIKHIRLQSTIDLELHSRPFAQQKRNRRAAESSR